jgi:hypothetical protein
MGMKLKSFTITGDHRLVVLENSVLRKIFGLKREEVIRERKIIA